MGLTITKVLSGPLAVIPFQTKTMFGDKFVMIPLSVAFDSSYVTGGEDLDLTEYFGGNASILIAVIIPEDTQGYVTKYIQDTNRTISGGKLKLYYADYDAVADGVLIEVANAVDVSDLTAVRVIVIGVIG